MFPTAPFKVASRWFEGTCDIRTYELDELLGTMLRAICRRKQARDLPRSHLRCRAPHADRGRPDHARRLAIDVLDPTESRDLHGLLPERYRTGSIVVTSNTSADVRKVMAARNGRHLRRLLTRGLSDRLIERALEGHPWIFLGFFAADLESEDGLRSPDSTPTAQLAQDPIFHHHGRVRLVSRLRALSLAAALAGGCGSSQVGPTPPEPGPLPGFAMSGDPTSDNGATWTYEDRVSGITYDLRGILLKPQGTGPFPAVIISHGAGASAEGYGRAIARVMIEWGVVCIATNYTHAGGVPFGSPGTLADAGAGTANVSRARRLVEILRALDYVDMSRLALHGHSLGAFVTTAVAGTHPDLFRAASHTAGGMGPSVIPAVTPTTSQVAGVRAPYQMHHGVLDIAVPLYADELLASAFRTQGVEHELVVYPAADHDDLRVDSTVLARVRAWYARHGVP